MKKLILILAIICLYACNINKDFNEDIIEDETKNGQDAYLVEFNIDGLPYGPFRNKFYMKIELWNEEVNLGHIEYESPVREPRNFNDVLFMYDEYTHFYIYLYTDDTDEKPVYFTYNEKSDTHVYSNSYWLYYSDYYDRGVIDFGFSEYLTTDITIDNGYECDFVDEPYYLYHLRNMRGQSFKFSLDGNEDILIEYHNNFSILYNGGDAIIDQVEIINYEYEDFYILIRPVDYNNITPIEFRAEYIVEDDFEPYRTLSQYQSIAIGNDFFTYISKDNSLIQIDRINETYNTIYRFDSDIKSFKCDDNNSKLYIIEGENIWQYTYGDESPVFVYEANYDYGSTITVSPTNNFLIIKDRNIYLTLLDLNDFTVLDSFNYYTHEYYCYSESLNSIVLLYFNKLIKIPILDSEKKFGEVETVDLVSLTYSVYNDLQFFGDGSKVITSTGTTYDITDGIQLGPIFDTDFNKFKVINNKIYLVNDDFFAIYSTDDYSLISTPIVFDDDTIGKDLFIFNDKVIIISQNINDLTIHNIEVDQ